MILHTGYGVMDTHISEVNLKKRVHGMKKIKFYS